MLSYPGHLVFSKDNLATSALTFIFPKLKLRWWRQLTENDTATASPTLSCQDTFLANTAWALKHVVWSCCPHRVWPCAQTPCALPPWGLLVSVINPMALWPMSTLKSKAFQTKLWQLWWVLILDEWAAWNKVPRLLCPGCYALARVAAF